MSEEFIKVFTESRIIVRRLHQLLDEAEMPSRIKSDTIPGYEITNNIDELFILHKDLEKASPIIEAYKTQINS